MSCLRGPLLPSCGKVLGRYFSARGSRKISACGVGFAASAAAGCPDGFAPSLGVALALALASAGGFWPGATRVSCLGDCDRVTRGNPPTSTIESNTHEHPPEFLGANALIM